MSKITRVPLEIYLENIGKTVTLYLTKAEHARAIKDSAFLLKLVNEENIRQKNMPVSQNYNTEEETDICISSVEEDLSSSVSEASQDLYALSGHPHTSTQNVELNEDSTENDRTLFIWSSKNVYLLLEKYEEHMKEFSSGTKRHSKIWDNIASDINKIDPEITVLGTQCQSKMNSMKKMFRKIIDHNNVSGNDRKSWQYFERMYELFGRSGWANPKATASEAGTSSSAVDENKNIKEVPAKKLKSDKILDEFMKQMKQDRQEREKKKEERMLVVLQELKEQKETQHKEKIDVMKKFCEAIVGKKLFD